MPQTAVNRDFLWVLLMALLCATLFVQWQTPPQPQPRPTPTPDNSTTGLMERGKAALSREKVDSAHLCFAQAKELYLQQQNWEGVAQASYYLARLDNRNAHLEFDTIELDYAFTIAEKYLPPQNYWRNKIWVGKGIHLFWKTPHLDSAYYYFDKARKIYTETQDWQSVVETTFYLARVWGNRQDKERQWNELQYAYTTMRERLPKMNFWTGEVLYFIASRYLNKLDSATAKQYLTEAQEIHKAIGEGNSYLKTCNYLAEYCLEKQQFAEMKRHLDEAAEYVRQNPAWERRMQEIHQYYGKYYSRIGDYEKALEHYEKVFDFVVEDSLYLAYHFYSMGTMLLEQNDLERANDYFQNALLNAQRHQQAELIPSLHTNFGTIAERKNSVLSAMQSHRTAIKAAHALINTGNDDYNEGLKSIINSNLAMARIFMNAELPDSALHYLEHNRTIHQTYPYSDFATYSLWADWYETQKQVPMAIAALKEALLCCRRVYGAHHPEVANLYHELGLIHQKEEMDSLAINYYQSGLQALDVNYPVTAIDKNPAADKITNLTIFRKLLVSKAEMLEKAGNIPFAYQTIQEAIKAVEKLQTSFKTESSKLFNQQQALPTYERGIQLAWLLYDSLQDKQYAENAFRYAEQNKSLLLLDALRSNEAERFGGVPDSLQDRENNLHRSLVFYQQQLTEAQRTRDTVRQNTAQQKILGYQAGIKKLQDFLEQNFPKYYEAKYAPRLAGSEQIRKRLPPNTLLLEYFVGNEAVFGFSISQEGMVFKKLKKSSNFERQIHHFYNGVSMVNTSEAEAQLQYNEYVQSASLLYENMVQPLLQPNVNRLVVVPDAQLNYVAFDALLTRTVPAGKPTYKQLPYLINDYAIHYHYSASLWVNHRQIGRNKGQVLAMAASYDSTDWQLTRNAREQTLRRDLLDIPGAREEVYKLEKNFQGSFLTGAPANEANFKQLATTGDYSVVHLAMHGLVDKRHANNSGLVLTKTNDTLNDDILHAYELNLLELNADLVVLSACETGYGRLEKGEGVLSLGRSFMYAGAPSLVNTFWPLNDQTSPIIIADFYRQLGERVPKDQALRRSKMNYLQDADGISTHPFFWASFSTLGDEAPLLLAYTIPLWTYLWVLFSLLLYFFVGWKFKKQGDAPLSSN